MLAINVWINISIWVAVLIFMIIIEMSTAQLVSIWFAAGSVVALILSAFNVPLWIQILSFAVVSLVLLATIKPIMKKKEQENAGTTVPYESIIGEEVVVTKEINRNVVGEIKAKFDYYSALCNNEDDSFQVGERVKIVALEGNKVKVEKL